MVQFKNSGPVFIPMHGTAAPRTWAALPLRFPLAPSALELRGSTCNSHFHASRGSAHFHAFCESHIRAIPCTRKPRSSTQLEAAFPRISMNSQPTHSRAFPRNNTGTLTCRRFRGNPRSCKSLFGATAKNSVLLNGNIAAKCNTKAVLYVLVNTEWLFPGSYSRHQWLLC